MIIFISFKFLSFLESKFQLENLNKKVEMIGKERDEVPYCTIICLLLFL